MLIRADDPHVDVSAAVHDRFKVHFKAFIVAGEFPGRHVILFSVLHGDFKGDPAQFVGNAVIEQHVFAGGAGVSEAVADIEAEGHALRKARGGTPVPGIVIRPHAATPIQHGEGMGGRKQVFPVPMHGLALRPQAVDLLIIIERLGMARKGRGDDHGILWRAGQRHVEQQGLAVSVGKAIHVAVQAALLSVVFKGEGVALAGYADIPHHAGGGQLAPAEGRQDAGPGGLAVIVKIQEGHAVHVQIAVVGNGQGQGVPVRHDAVIIPFLDAHGRGFHRPTIVILDEGQGVAPFRQASVCVQQRAGGGHLVLLHGQASFSDKKVKSGK